MRLDQRWRWLGIAVLVGCGTSPSTPDGAGSAPVESPTAAREEPTDPRAPPASRDEAPPPAAPPPPGQIDPRDQYALGREIEVARHADPEQIDARYSAIRRSWTSRRFQWEMGVSRLFCTTAGTCALMPFDFGRRGFDGGGSYMPLLRTTAESQARIEELCRPHEACVIRFEAVLSRLDLSTMDATHLELTDVRVLAARPARRNERWVRPVNVPEELRALLRDGSDAGILRVGSRETPDHQRLEALVQRVHGRTDAGTGAAPTPPSGTTPATQSSTPRVGP